MNNNDDIVFEVMWDQEKQHFVTPKNMSEEDKKRLFGTFPDIPFDILPPGTKLN